jgi:hypothetical protein
MWLIYAVENMTYESGIFGIFAFFLVILFAAAKIYNTFLLKPARSTTNPPEIEEGFEYVLGRAWYKWSAGDAVEVKNIWKSLNEVRIKGQGSTDFNLKTLKLAVTSGTTEIAGDIPLNFPFKTVIWGFIICMILHTALPSRQTAIYMAGGYMAQEIITSEKTGELSNLAYDAAKAQLISWAKEVPELQGMVTGAVGQVLESTQTEVKQAAEVLKEATNAVSVGVESTTQVATRVIEAIKEVKGES